MTTALTRRRRTATRLLAAAVPTAVAVALLGAVPAHAADPAVTATPAVTTTFDGGSSCPIADGGDEDDDAMVTVPMNGTKKVDVAASGSATAENTGDPDDVVEMRATNKITGSVSGKQGAFTGASLAMAQKASFDADLLFSSSCDPTIELEQVATLEFRVKAKGRLTTTLNLPRDTLGVLVIATDDGLVMNSVSYYFRGIHTFGRTLTPGSYVMQVAHVAELALFGDTYVLDHAATATFKSSFTKS